MDSSVIARQALRLCSVRSSFSPIFLLKPTTSAARIAASFRLGVVFFIFIRQVGIFDSFQITHRTICGCSQIQGEASNSNSCKHVDILIVLLYAFYEDVCLVCNVKALKSKLLLPTLSTFKLRSYYFYHDHTWGNSSFLS